MLLRFLFTFLITWTCLYGDGFNISSFSSKKESTSFFCPHQCGQWGSKSLQDIEWEFILLLYQADKIHTFLSSHSRPYSPITSLKEFLNYSFYPQPQDFRSSWYQSMLHTIPKKLIRLGIDDFDINCPGNCYNCTYGLPCKYCKGSHNYIWWIQPIETEEGIHIGSIFIKREGNYVAENGYCYSWYHLKEGSFISAIETQYRFDNFVDFKEACVNLNQELIWLRNDVHGLNRFAQKEHIRSVSDMQYQEFVMGLKEIEHHYTMLFSSCANKHRAPSALYHMALASFATGDHARALQHMENIFERINLNVLESHLASKLSLSQGLIQNEVALYDQALLSLKTAIDHDPKNKQAYFDQALTLFEQGRFEEAAKSYLNSQHFLKLLDKASGSLIEFSVGLIQGITASATHNLANFIPSMCSSIYGLSHGLWAFVLSPKEVSQEIVCVAQSLADFLSSHTALETFQTLVPEVKKLAALSPNEHKQKGNIVGTIIGKYGTEFLTYFATVKGFKLYRELKQANGALTLHALHDLEKGERLQALSHTWWEKTAPVIEEIKASGGVVGEELYKAFRNQNLNELQVRRILHGADFKTFPKPQGIPNDVTVNISKKGGGMVYMKAGTIKKQSMFVRVMPGNPQSPNVMQRKPYVIQRRGKEAISKSGQIVDYESMEAHIPLEDFEFQGW